MQKPKMLIGGRTIAGLAVILALILAGAGYVAWRASKAEPFTVAAFMQHVDLGDCYGLSMGFQIDWLDERGSEAVPQLIARLEDSADPEVRQSALVALYYFQEDAGLAVSPLLDVVVGDDDEQIRRLAIFVLGNQVQHAESVVPVLADILDSAQDQDLHADAAMALGRLGLASRDATSALGRATHATDPLVRARAVEAIGAIGPAAAVALPELISTLDDHDRLVRWWAAVALQEIGPDAAPAVPALVRMLESRSSLPSPPSVRPQSEPARARGFFDPDVMADILDQPDCAMHARDGVEKARERMERFDLGLAPPILAAKTLWAIGPAAVDAIPALRAAAADERYPDVQLVARYALDAVSGSGPEWPLRRNR